MIEERPLLLQIQQFMRDHGMARTRFGREAVGDPRLVDDLCGGREPSQRVRDKVRGFIAEQRARGVPVVAEKPRREPVRRAPAPVSELNLRAAAPRPHHDVLPTSEGERRQRSNAPRLIAEVLLRGGGALELIDATERDWFSATFEGARHRLRFALAKEAALPPRRRAPDRAGHRAARRDGDRLPRPARRRRSGWGGHRRPAHRRRHGRALRRRVQRARCCR